MGFRVMIKVKARFRLGVKASVRERVGIKVLVRAFECASRWVVMVLGSVLISASTRWTATPTDGYVASVTAATFNDPVDVAACATVNVGSRDVEA